MSHEVNSSLLHQRGAASDLLASSRIGRQSASRASSSSRPSVGVVGLAGSRRCTSLRPSRKSASRGTGQVASSTRQAAPCLRRSTSVRPSRIGWVRLRQSSGVKVVLLRVSSPRPHSERSAPRRVDGHGQSSPWPRPEALVCHPRPSLAKKPSRGTRAKCVVVVVTLRPPGYGAREWRPGRRCGR